MVTSRSSHGVADDVQPWQTKLKDQYGIGVTLDTSRGNKRFKVRFRWHSKILNLGRFNDAHEARLAYDQAVATLAPGRKKTNYWPGTYQLTDPAVEAKLQQFLRDNPEAAADVSEAETHANTACMAPADAQTTAAPAALAATAAAAGAPARGSDHAAALHADPMSWQGLVDAGSSTRQELDALAGSRHAVSASPRLGSLGPAVPHPALPSLEEVDQGLYDWLLMMGPDTTQAGALHAPEARLPEQQHHQQQLGQQHQRVSLPLSMQQTTSGDGSGPLPQAAAAAGRMTAGNELQWSASNPGPALGAFATSSKPTTRSRPRSYSMNPQSAGVSKPASHRGYQAIMTMADSALAAGSATAAPGGRAAARSPSGMVPTATRGNSGILADVTALPHNQRLGLHSGVMQMAELSTPPAAAAAVTAAAAAGAGQGAVLAAIPADSLESPSSAQPAVMPQQPGLLAGWPSSSNTSSYQQLMLSQHPPAVGEGQEHGAASLQCQHLPAQSAYTAARNMPANGQQQQQLQQGCAANAASSRQASPIDVSSIGPTGDAAQGLPAPWGSAGILNGAADLQREAVPMPLRQTMWQQLSVLLHMQEQHQLQEEQQRQAAAAARASCQSQLQQQQLMIQELQQQMAELRSVLLLCKNSSGLSLTQSTPT